MEYSLYRLLCRSINLTSLCGVMVQLFKQQPPNPELYSIPSCRYWEICHHCKALTTANGLHRGKTPQQPAMAPAEISSMQSVLWLAKLKLPKHSIISISVLLSIRISFLRHTFFLQVVKPHWAKHCRVRSKHAASIKIL